MSFRQFGGLQYSARNNIISNNYSNSNNVGIIDTLGQPNSRIVSDSHIDMQGNSLLSVDSIYFSDGTIQTTAYTGSVSNTVLLKDSSGYIEIINKLVKEIEYLKQRVSTLENKEK